MLTQLRRALSWVLWALAAFAAALGGVDGGLAGALLVASVLAMVAYLIHPKRRE